MHGLEPNGGSRIRRGEHVRPYSGCAEALVTWLATFLDAAKPGLSMVSHTVSLVLRGYAFSHIHTRVVHKITHEKPDDGDV